MLEAVKFASKAMKYKEYEWYRLVLFLRHNGDEDGYLFEFQETPQQPSSQNNKDLAPSDIEILKEILIHSKLVSSYKRNNLLSNIGLNNNFAEKNIDNYTDGDFADILVDFLVDTQQLEILIKLCQQIESKIKIGNYHTKLQIIKSNLSYGKN